MPCTSQEDTWEPQENVGLPLIAENDAGKAAPIDFPRASPVIAPVASLVASPVASPVAPPATSPIAAPVAAPVAALDVWPIEPNVASPVASLDAPPVASPVASSVAHLLCEPDITVAYAATVLRGDGGLGTFLRTGPAVSADVLEQEDACVADGQEVEVLVEPMPSFPFSRVRFNGIIGYIKTAYLVSNAKRPRRQYGA